MYLSYWADRINTVKEDHVFLLSFNLAPRMLNSAAFALRFPSLFPSPLSPLPSFEKQIVRVAQ
jgi:hypothetical protein